LPAIDPVSVTERIGIIGLEQGAGRYPISRRPRKSQHDVLLR
jgi:hypothetical protein